MNQLIKISLQAFQWKISFIPYSTKLVQEVISREENKRKITVPNILTKILSYKQVPKNTSVFFWKLDQILRNISQMHPLRLTEIQHVTLPFIKKLKGRYKLTLSMIRVTREASKQKLKRQWYKKLCYIFQVLLKLNSQLSV